MRKTPLLLAMMIIATGQVGVSIYLPSLPLIGHDLNLPQHSIQNLVTLFLVGFGISQLFYGPLSDAIGRRPVFILGQSVYLVGTVICIAFSDNIIALEAGRLLQGLGAFGSFVGVDRFADFQVPFESQFEGWSGGSKNNGMTRHFTRYGEGNYTCSGGWPSLTGVNIKPFLEQGPTGERVFMRVCDWWRREGDLLMENWVFVDIPHVLLQMGYDLFAEMEAKS